LRKGQLLAHARSLYAGALAEATGLLRAKIEKRVALSDLQAATGGAAPSRN